MTLLSVKDHGVTLKGVTENPDSVVLNTNGFTEAVEPEVFEELVVALVGVEVGVAVEEVGPIGVVIFSVV